MTDYRTHPLATEHPTEGLRVITPVPSPGARSIGPFVSVARFRLGRRVFPPHPHAGFTAMTYMLPTSRGAMLNRDSLGGVDVIEPGGAHWSIANAGLMHEETPLHDDRPVEGFQIFVKHPASADLAPPARFHAAAADLPVARHADGVEVRVVMGRWDDAEHQTGVPAEASMAEIGLTSGAHLDWTPPGGVELGVFVEHGSLRAAGGGPPIHAGTLLTWTEAAPVSLKAGADGATLYAFYGPPLEARPMARGPFMAFSEDALAAARRRYGAGEMGSLPPRAPGPWTGGNDVAVVS